MMLALLMIVSAGQTWAGNPTTLTVGGTDVLSGGYWLTNADGTLTADGASESDYNVKYDSATGTLTLKDATINGTETIGYVGAGIYAKGDLTIVLEGSSTVTGAVDGNGDSQSIRVEKNLTIQGGGSLTAKGADTTDDNSSYGIFVGGSFTQQGGNVTAIGGTCKSSRGLYVSVYTGNGTVTVQSGTLTATGGVASSGSYGIYISGTIGNNMTVTVSDATVTATGDTGKYSYGLYMDSSSSSVTLSGSGSLTARSGSATNTAGGIYFNNTFDNTGSVTVEDNSTLLANSVILYTKDQSWIEKPLAPTGDGSWLIYGQSDQPSAVGGTYTLEENFTIESGNTFTIPEGSTLTVPEGVTLTVNGTLINEGTLSIAAESCLTGSGSLQGNGSFTAVAVTIEVPEGVTCADCNQESGKFNLICEPITAFDHTFTANADGWTLTFTKGEVTLDGCTYTGTASKEGCESIEKTFTAQHSFGEDGKCACGAARPALDGEGRYQLADAFQLRWFAALVNGTLTDGTTQNAAASAVLTKSIDLTGENWTPIGTSSKPYTGTFDGQNNTISGMKIESTAEYQGFVSYLGENGKIQDLTLDVNCSVTGGKYTGGLCGWNNAGTITACTNSGAVNGSGDLGGICGHNLGTVNNCTNTGAVDNGNKETVGGICGYSKTALTGCTNSGAVTGKTYVGGIVGYTDDGAIENCQNSGSVTGNGDDVGGICGFSNQSITNCANTGAITGGNVVGGVCGLMVSFRVTISNCYNTGTVTGSGSNVGAVYGKNGRGQSGDGQGSITNCYYQSEETTSTQEGATPKTAEQFKSGEVACLLQGSQTTQAWGQTLGTDNYPVLTTDGARKVYAYSIYNGSDEAQTGYTNNGAVINLEGNAVAVVKPAGFVPKGEDVTNFIMMNEDGNTYTCASLVLTDGADFYSPVTFTAGEATYSRTLPATSTWGTVVLPFEATTTDATLYEATEIVADGSEESLLGVTATDNNILKANTPALLKANTPGTTVSFSATGATVEATTANSPIEKAIGKSGYSLTGTMKAISPLTPGCYFISADKFWSVGSQTTVGMKAFRACISAPAASGVRPSSMRIVVGGLTGIDHVGTQEDEPVDVYTTDGRQLRRGVNPGSALNGLPHGTYIVGGKKVSK